MPWPRNFSANANGAANINDNLGVGASGRLILGSSDPAWTPQSLIDTSAILALAQPARLGAGTGIHATGAGTPSPVANRVKFDASSLFVIDGSDARNYYVGEYVKSAQLSASKGAVGALSADAKGVSANVGSGAQIYIRNPIANTVIVALGQNIKTVYADSSRQRAAGGDPWKGVNLRYDNADKVKIERLNGDYAGQFSVVPITRDPDTPTDTPTTPDTPPTTPDTPSTPDNPAQPDDPNQPGEENPSEPPAAGPDKPTKPNKPPKPQETHPNAHPGIHDVIDKETGKDNVGNEARHIARDDGAGFLSNTIIHHNPNEATRLVEGAARMPILGATPQMTYAAGNAATEAMAARTSMPRLDGLRARGFALWAVPLYKTAGAFGLTAGNHSYDYSGGLGGVAIGGDCTFDDVLRLGLSFHIGGGYSKSDGDLAQTTNNLSFWGLGAYGVWSFANFALSSEITYTSSYNKLKQDISNLAGWNELKADLQAGAISAGLNLEYRFATDLLDIYPHAGARYHYIYVNDYDISHRGNDIINGNGFSQNIWTFPIGLKFTKDFSLENGWKITPSLDLRVTPTAGDIEVKTTSRFTGTTTDLSLRTQTMDYFTYGGSVGFEASIENFTAGVTYNLDAGMKSVSNSIFGTLRYEF